MQWLTGGWSPFSRIISHFCSSSDAVREVDKYSRPESLHDAKANPSVYDHVHMKLFRAQRNLYISGFSLFLWLWVYSFKLIAKVTITLLDCPLTHSFLVFCGRSVMRRIFSLLNQVAITLEDNNSLQTQMDSAVKAAQQCQEDNRLLERVSPGQGRQRNFSLSTSCNH